MLSIAFPVEFSCSYAHYFHTRIEGNPSISGGLRLRGEIQVLELRATWISSHEGGPSGQIVEDVEQSGSLVVLSL